MFIRSQKRLQKLIVLFSVLLFNSLNSSTLILSNPENRDESFSFPVGPHTIYIPHGRFFVGATKKVKGNDFALAYGIRPTSQFNVIPSGQKTTENTFKPLAPALVRLNNEPSVSEELDEDEKPIKKEFEKNPLHGAAISDMVMIDRRLLVTKPDVSKFYVVDDMLEMSRGVVNVFSSPNIHSSEGFIAEKILSITSSAPYIQEDPDPVLQDRIAFAAIEEEPGRSLGLAAFVFNYTKTDSSLTYQFNPINAQTGDLNENKAIEINLDTPQIKIGNSLALLKNSADIYFEKSLNRLYVALGAQAGSASGDGAFGVMAVAGVSQGKNGDEIGKLIFAPIVTSSAIDSNDKIVGSLGSGSQVQIFKVRAMITTTHLNYLIAVGGNGFDTQNQVYALPLVNNIANAAHGTLANVNQVPTDIFTQGAPHSFVTRTYLNPAKNSNEIYSNTDIPAIVGAGPAISSITDIQVVNDTVFVSVDENGQNERSGIFYSQAIFDEYGRIKSWTPWLRSTGNAKEIFGFAYDSSLGITWYIPTLKNMQNVYRAGWSKGDSIIERTASQEFPADQGGVLGLFDFPMSTPGFSQDIGERLSFIALAGLDKVSLIQTGSDNNSGVFGPTKINLELDSFSSNNGSLKGYSGSAKMVTVANGDLSKVGCVNSVAIVNDSSNGWLVVGGAEGVAVLANQDGSGWQVSPGLQKDFKGLQSSMAFKKIHDFIDIKKIIGLDNVLYVLSSAALYKLEFSQDNIANLSFEVTRLVTASSLGQNLSSFSDLVISPPLGLLATSVGLFSSMNSELTEWDLVEMPDAAGSFFGSGPATRFWPINLGSAEDIKNGNIWVLNSYVGLNQAQIYRYTLNSNSSEPISLFPDLFIPGKRTFFVNLDDYRNYIATDGAIITASRSAYADRGPKEFLLSNTLKSGQRFAGRKVVDLQIGIQDFCTIGSMIRVSASGAWLVHGDFGLRINE